MMRIRPPVAADEAAWRPLWRGHLEFYNSALPEETTADTWRRLLGDGPQFGLAAEESGELVGFAHCLIHPSTWSRAGYCYLEDLFVSPDARGKGAGRAFIEAIYRIADERGCDRVYWRTQETNAVARGLYDRLASRSEFVQYRR